MSERQGRKPALSAYPEMRRRRVAQDDGPEEEEGVKGGMIRERILPCVLIAAGVALLCTQINWTAPQLPKKTDLSPGQGIVFLVLGVATLYAGAAAAVVVLKLNLGRLGPTALKLASIAVIGIGLATPVARLDNDSWSITGMAMGYFVLIITYWVLIPIYYRMELYEVLLGVAIITLLQTVAFAAVLT